MGAICVVSDLLFTYLVMQRNSQLHIHDLSDLTGVNLVLKEMLVG